MNPAISSLEQEYKRVYKELEHFIAAASRTQLQYIQYLDSIDDLRNRLDSIDSALNKLQSTPMEHRNEI